MNRQTGDGTVWIGGFILHAYHKGAWRLYTSESLPAAPLPSHRTCLLKAFDGALWMAGLGQEVVRLDYGPSRWTVYDGLSFFCETSDGTSWFVGRDSSVVSSCEQGWTRYDLRTVRCGSAGRVFAALMDGNGCSLPILKVLPHGYTASMAHRMGACGWARGPTGCFTLTDAHGDGPPAFRGFRTSPI